MSCDAAAAAALELREIAPRGALYAAERALRARVLREPLGLPPGSEVFPFEADSIHLVACRGDEVCGCVLFHPDGSGSGRLYQMAIAPEWQRRGVGRRLVRRLEELLRARGVREVTLHARDAAVDFYRRLGYETYGEPFVEVGHPHRHMRRTIS